MITGYFARLDYVSFVIQEFGLNPDKVSRSESQIESSVILKLNYIQNHFLNTACTVSDAGAVGSIL